MRSSVCSSAFVSVYLLAFAFARAFLRLIKGVKAFVIACEDVQVLVSVRALVRSFVRSLLFAYLI